MFIRRDVSRGFSENRRQTRELRMFVRVYEDATRRYVASLLYSVNKFSRGCVLRRLEYLNILENFSAILLLALHPPPFTLPFAPFLPSSSESVPRHFYPFN